MLLYRSRPGGRQKTEDAPLAQPDRVFDYESKGHRFESCGARQRNLETKVSRFFVFYISLPFRSLGAGRNPAWERALSLTTGKCIIYNITESELKFLLDGMNG